VTSRIDKSEGVRDEEKRGEWTARSTILIDECQPCGGADTSKTTTDSNDGPLAYLTAAEKTSSISRLVEQPEEDTSWSRLSVQMG